MSTDTAYRPAENLTSDTSDDDSFAHRFCACNDKIALCGKQKDEWVEVEENDPTEMCIVCEHLHLARKCPLCMGKS